MDAKNAKDFYYFVCMPFGRGIMWTFDTFEAFDTSLRKKHEHSKSSVDNGLSFEVLNNL